MEWACLSGAAFLFYNIGFNVSVNSFGNSTALYNHWVAYNFVKSNNRWEGRRILKKAPLMY